MADKPENKAQRTVRKAMEAIERGKREYKE